MSNITHSNQAATFENVSADHPCKNCGTKTNYCWYLSEDPTNYGCRAHDGPGGRRKVDANGVEHWVFGRSNRLPQDIHEEAKHEGSLTGTIEERHRAYRALLDGLELDEEPFDGARALGYCTAPVGAVARYQAAKRIWDIDPEKKEFLRIPGTRIVHHAEDNRDEPTLRSMAGTYIPVTDFHGHIAALQVRLDEPRPGVGKYLAFSGRPGEGSKSARICHVPTRARALRQGDLTDPSEVVRVTEGVKKADVATLRTPVMTLGLPSANAWKLAWEPISQFHAITVRFAFDSDACKTRSVCTALVSAIQFYASSVSRVLELEVWPSKYKGLDDALLANAPLEVLVGRSMYERLLEWCQASGATVPDWLQDKVAVLKAAELLEESPGLLHAPETLKALVRLEHCGDVGPVQEALQTLHAAGAKDGVRYKFERALASMRAELRRQEKESKAQERRDAAEAEGLPVFERGSDTELATRLSKQLPLVYDEGAYWGYRESEGYWVEIEPTRIERLIMSWDGSVCGRAELAINDGKVRGTIRRYETLRTRKSFFGKAPTGFTFRNGFVQVDATGVHLIEHDQEQRSRFAYPYGYDPEADCDEFERFLWSIFSPIDFGRADEMSAETEEALTETRQRIQFIKEFFGLCLLGLATRYVGMAVILLGDGANGKSTLLELIEDLFPAGSLSGVVPQEWTNDQSVALLRGKLINIVGELPNKTIHESSVWKAVMTGDTLLKGKNVFEKPFEFKARAGHVIAANGMGAAGDGSYGWARRAAIIPMTRVYMPHEQDETLPAKLRAESQGIVATLLSAAADALARGRICTVPASSAEALSDWMSDSDPVRSYVRNLKGTLDLDECSSMTPAEHMSKLYKGFRAHAEDEGRKPMSLPTFKNRVHQAIRELAREDLQARFTAAAEHEPFFAGGTTGQLEQLSRNGVIRRKVDGSSVRRLPFVRPEAEAVEEELDACLRDLEDAPVARLH